MADPQTFLDICKRTARECGVAGDGPTAVTGQTGEHARIVNWVQSAYNQIQTLHEDWGFLFGTGGALDLNTTDQAYTAPYTSGNVREFAGDLYLFDTNVGASDKQRLIELDYFVFRKRYLGTNIQTGRPTHYAITPNRASLMVNTVPDIASYRIDYDYWRTAHSLTDTTDTTLIGQRHNMTIVWRAVMLYAQYEEAVNLKVFAEAEYLRHLKDLREAYLPKRTFQVRPLA